MDQYSPDLIANAFLHKARQSGAHHWQMTHMKLQKLAFFMHAWGLALKGQSPLNERPEAWDYGPVFGSLYHVLKGYGSSEVNTYLEQMNPYTGRREAMLPNINDVEFWGLLEQVWMRYGGLDALQLSSLTHERGSPWETAKINNYGWLDDNEVGNFYRRQIV